jgi:hypothetical protein
MSLSRMVWIVVALAALPAAAQEASFEALGQAPVVGGDRVRARERALEEALKQAVEQATSTVLEPSALVARSSDLRLRIYPKARSYVSNYRVLDEGEQAGVFQMHISAQVATARLARDLAAPGDAKSAARPVSRARAVVCVHTEGGPLPSVDKAARELVTVRNVDAIPGPAACTDEAAAQAAQAAGAQGALTAAVEATPAGPIRGTDKVAAHARAQLHLIEAGGRVSAEGSGERDAYDATVERAAESAARAAVVEAARTLQPALQAKWSNDVPTGGVGVHLAGVARYADYLAVERALAALPGVGGVEPRRFSRGEVDLLVRTASTAAQLRSGLERMPPAGVRISGAPDGDAQLKLHLSTVEGG